MFKYNLINYPSFEVNEKVIDTIFKIVSNLVSKQQNGIVNIVFLDSESIKNLNKTYRNIDKNTDVLSFHYYEDFSDLKDEDTAGEIVLSEEKILSQAIEYGLGNEKELYKLIIHSLLHILGYDHILDNDYKNMQNMEDIIWQELFEK